jgi:hypothetical protein
MLAVYVDRDGQQYAAGCERGGRRRRGWWYKEIDESRRSGGYRNLAPGSKADALDGVRELAGVGVERQARLDAFASDDGEPASREVRA